VWATGLVLAFLAVTGFGAEVPSPRSADAALPCELTTTDRIVAVGDVHGAYDRFVSILRAAELLDEGDRWIGGAAVLVQTGDVLDRGDDSRRVLDLLRRLEVEAAEAGGSVQALIGNHEVMRMVGDLRYVSDGEYAAFKSAESDSLRERLYQIRLADQIAQTAATAEEFDEAAFREAFMEATPPGLIETVLAFAPTGEYGQWIRQHNVMVVINGIAFVHGGASPYVAPLGCAAINAIVRVELESTTADPRLIETLAASPSGPLWYRGLADPDPALTIDHVDAILAALDARTMVIGHSVVPGYRVRAQFDNRVFQIDTGMLGESFYPGGVASAIEFRGETVTAIYEDGPEVLVSGSGALLVDHVLFAVQVDAFTRQRQNRVPARND
jgi:hypothetical protein